MVEEDSSTDFAVEGRDANLKDRFLEDFGLGSDTAVGELFVSEVEIDWREVEADKEDLRVSEIPKKEGKTSLREDEEGVCERGKLWSLESHSQEMLD